MKKALICEIQCSFSFVRQSQLNFRGFASIGYIKAIHVKMKEMCFIEMSSASCYYLEE